MSLDPASTPASGQALRDAPFAPRALLLTGASGYLGTLIAAGLLQHDRCELILPMREGTDPDAFLQRLDTELKALGSSLSSHAGRLRILPWRGHGEVGNDAWAAQLDGAGIDEIIHCAGCLDYFDSAALTAVNIELTEWLLAIGRRWRVSRFSFVSTAYSAGYTEQSVPERLLAEPASDPTDYTRTKRAAEHRVAASGLPWLILRPSILVGEWDSGRYSGKRYGVYQQWMGLERLMVDRYHAEMHTVAPLQPLNLIHQDAFQQAFLQAWRWLPERAVCNIVSDGDSAPTMRELWNLWMQVVRPREIYYYPRFEDVDLRAINMRQRAYLTFARVNLEIGAHPWRFDSDWLRLLEAARGLEFRHATLDSMQRCLGRFVSSSDALARYLERFADEFPSEMISHEVHC
jgi:nucleoside-diphosphate-sugar epimerase